LPYYITFVILALQFGQCKSVPHFPAPLVISIVEPHLLQIKFGLIFGSSFTTTGLVAAFPF